MTATGSGARIPVRRSTAAPTWSFGNLLIRRYRPADHAAVLALHREGLARIGLRPGDGVYYEDDLHRMAELYAPSGGGEFLVGELRGEPVAMGGLRRVEPTVGEMVRLRVRPDLHRLGYGEALVVALEERAREFGYLLLRGDTTHYQGAALELYRKFGWRETRREVINGIVNIYGEKHLG